jgi:hypothetical protein
MPRSAMRDRERSMSRAELARSVLVNLGTASSHLGVAYHELRALRLPAEPLLSIATLVDNESARATEELEKRVVRTREEGM